MIAKAVIFVLIIAVIYFVFFKKPRNHSKSAQDFIECEKCSSFNSADEMVLSNGKYYCKECLK